MAFVAQVYNAAPVPFFYFKLTRQYNMFTAWKKTNYYNGDHWHCSRGCCANMISVTSILCACDHEYIIFFFKYEILSSFVIILPFNVKMIFVLFKMMENFLRVLINQFWQYFI